MTDAVHTNTPQSIAHLAALTQLYLLQEYSLDTWLPSDRDTFLHFRNQAIEKKRHQNVVKIEPIAVQGPPPLPPILEEETVAAPAPSKDAINESLAPQKVAIPPQKAATQPTPTPTNTAQPKTNASAPPPPQSQQVLLEPVAAPSATDFSSIKTCFAKLFPHYPLVHAIPTDAHAQRLSLLWKQDPVQSAAVIILVIDPPDEERQLLSRLCSAMQKQSVSAIVLDGKKWEMENEWGILLEGSSLKLVVAASSCLTQLPKLQSNHRTVGNDHYLHNVRLLVSEETKYYILEPKRKIALWDSLCVLMPPLQQQ